MSITLELAPDLEQQLRQAAAQVGQSPDTYIVEVLRQRLNRLPQQSAGGHQLSPAESALLMRINQSLSSIDWERYHELVAKRQAETLMVDEQQELIALSDRIEDANVQRMSYLAELARLRKTSLDSLTLELGIKPASYA